MWIAEVEIEKTGGLDGGCGGGGGSGRRAGRRKQERKKGWFEVIRHAFRNQSLLIHAMGYPPLAVLLGPFLPQPLLRVSLTW